MDWATLDTKSEWKFIALHSLIMFCDLPSFLNRIKCHFQRLIIWGGGLNRLGVIWPISLTVKPVNWGLKRSLNDLPNVTPIVHGRARMEEMLPREATLCCVYTLLDRITISSVEGNAVIRPRHPVRLHSRTGASGESERNCRWGGRGVGRDWAISERVVVTWRGWAVCCWAVSDLWGPCPGQRYMHSAVVSITWCCQPGRGEKGGMLQQRGEAWRDCRHCFRVYLCHWWVDTCPGNLNNLPNLCIGICKIRKMTLFVSQIGERTRWEYVWTRIWEAKSSACAGNELKRTRLL